MSSISRGLVAFLAVAGTQAAFAHASLLSSTPGNQESVVSAPAEIRLKFNEPVEANFSNVKVIGPANKETAANRAEPVEGRADTLRVALPPLPAGAYRAEWSAMGRDGHRTKGTVFFTVK